jgi:hypothetical protein
MRDRLTLKQMRRERLDGTSRFERIIRLFSFSLALAVGCGGGNGPAGNPIDCNWLSGPNCYQSTFSPAFGCLPNAMGKLSADGKTCTFASGQIITFDSPVTVPLPSGALVSFTLTTGGGTQCLKATQSSADSFTLTTSAGTFVWTAGGGAASAVCPDGSSYAGSGSSLFQAETCAKTLPPDLLVESGSADVAVGLGGTGMGSSAILALFDCRPM